jgi:hypothetical protein
LMGSRGADAVVCGGAQTWSKLTISKRLRVSLKSRICTEREWGHSCGGRRNSASESRLNYAIDEHQGLHSVASTRSLEDQLDTLSGLLPTTRWNSAEFLPQTCRVESGYNRVNKYIKAMCA